MIQFNELRINSKESSLIIDISVKDKTYYQNVYINKVSIDTQDTFIDSGPSNHPIYTKTIDDNSKTLKLELGIKDFLPSTKDNMFFIWVETKGIPSSDTPCGEDNTLTLGVTFDFYPIYQYIINFTKEIEDTCSVPKEFINSILQFKAIQYAIRTGHYTLAIKYWNRIFKKLNMAIPINECNCYG